MYRLQVVTLMNMIDYDKRLVVTRSLRRLVEREGVKHKDRKSAVRAAQVISQHVLVEHVMMTRETQEGKWQNGKAV